MFRRLLFLSQAVAVQAFVSACIVGPIGTSVLEHLMHGAIVKNALLLSANVDRPNSAVIHLPMEQVYGAMQQQALMVSMKEIYGWLSLLAIICLMVFLFSQSSIRPKIVLHPRYRVIRRWVKHELRMNHSLKTKSSCLALLVCYLVCYRFGITCDIP